MEAFQSKSLQQYALFLITTRDSLSSFAYSFIKVSTESAGIELNLHAKKALYSMREEWTLNVHRGSHSRISESIHIALLFCHPSNKFS
jgi:hypothetical protein